MSFMKKQIEEGVYDTEAEAREACGEMYPEENQE